MTVTINIPDAIAPTIVDNICAATNYDAGSGQTKAQWAKGQIINHIKVLNQSGAMRIAREAQAAAESQIT